MCSIPQRCAQRPLAGGLVVPYVSLVHSGHVVFGTLNADLTRTAFLRGLCQICGQPLDTRCFLIVSPADVARGYSPEPALHPECLPYTVAHCPMLNGTATHYRSRPALTGHPAGRSCSDPLCPCPSQSPDEAHASRTGSPADRFEAWMISTKHYRLVLGGRASVPCGISLDAPILRQWVLRTAWIPPGQEHLMEALRALGICEP
ncbi:cell envelope biogenesis protein OmpA [Streptomyces flavofungini]|uniref:Cell envelope biogenesis protein OmpA n=1 Tax=Streptomyces flavofungini TaxID=68200 RepID=A0ABS0XHE0_9ACTN|nr:cell envelope biogenesis protein OmpA [Streptomyces flavofungini]MBJ3812314.1 cell envelope biogenesis protein OmpA [Streptomyces flavofungini]GHC88513.1 hypothetical protein GCM10010349_75840 [Streptomyces flavofungini]